MKITLIGIGQSLRGDDGIGPAAVRQWSLDFSATASDPRVNILSLETPGLDLLEYLEGADAAVLVDAVSTGKSPGTVQVMASIPESGLSASEKTAHGFGVAETISVARKTGIRLPQRLILIGIEGKQFELGSGLSEPVHLAIPEAVREIQKLVAEALAE
jgi:hydrogenase maturation protease